MKLLFTILSISLLTFVACTIAPWWIIAVIAFLVSLLARLRPGRGFLAGFLGIGLCWLALALFRDAANEHILAGRMATLFHLPGHYAFVGVTAFVGALVGGLAAWAGSLLAHR